ncbi:MAG: V-type ATP synthase subunit A [Desulfovermiculus sp.]|nr:V-type ATP synthase subunit A [Desulfovermiculus sp.]
MNQKTGRVVGVKGNLLTVEYDQAVFQNEMAYVRLGDEKLKAEVVRIRGSYAELQVFEDTSGLKINDQVVFSNRLLSVELGPGLLGHVFDGLQTPLYDLAAAYGVFLQRGAYLPALDRDTTWSFTPSATSGQSLRPGDFLGWVPEGPFEHRITVPLSWTGRYTVSSIVPAGDYGIEYPVAVLTDRQGAEHEVHMLQNWPVKVPIRNYAERLRPQEPLTTKIRCVDTIFPVAKGGTYCIPGPFGAGKTVIQQLTSRHADVDVVIIAACGERAGEVVETIRTFPQLTDPITGRSLMERTIIVCNTSSMPVASREASVYTAVTLAEYYRQMGLDCLLLADSTSRWAQALREISGRLEEIPGEEAFPAYLESVIAAFYERAGVVRLYNGSQGSVTIGGTVSPAGGNFEEPVTQSTLKVVGAFHALSRQRSDARRYPAIDPLESWSQYPSLADAQDVELAASFLHQSHDIAQMMKVVGEEGTSLEDFVVYLKGEYLDAVFLQQDAFHSVDGATPAQRQKDAFARICFVLNTEMSFDHKDQARSFFQNLTQTTLDWNRSSEESQEFASLGEKIKNLVAEQAAYA